MYDILDEPKYLYNCLKGVELSTLTVIVHKEHVVISPADPNLADAIVMTLSIKDKLEIVGRFNFDDNEAKRDAVHQVRNFQCIWYFISKIVPGFFWLEVKQEELL